MIRHFTSTVFVVQKNKIALHWHEKVKYWLPPGGHVEPNEDPIQTAFRECKEEMGIEITIFSKSKYIFTDNGLKNISPPETILIEAVSDEEIGDHEHIDFIYFGYPKSKTFTLDSKWIWVDKDSLIKNQRFKTLHGTYESPPKDVIEIGINAINSLKSLQDT